jgi:hypothetical protein
MFLVRQGMKNLRNTAVLNVENNSKPELLTLHIPFYELNVLMEKLMISRGSLN